MPPIPFPRAGLLLPLLVAATACSAPDHDLDVDAMESPETVAGEGSHEGLVHGRVTMEDGTVYQGRLRWGGDEEALWTHHFNGRKRGDRWGDLLPRGEAPDASGRPFLARFGDLARIETTLREIRVTLKSGESFVLDRFEADDLADGLRIWDDAQGLVDLGEWRIRSVEFQPGERGDGPRPLHGTVRTAQGAFTGFLQWNRTAGLVTDTFMGVIPFRDIAAIQRRSAESALVTLVDGSERVVSVDGGDPVAPRGVYVDDPRFGRVLVSWDTLEGVELDDGGTGPGYDDFTPGGPLEGIVTTRSGERLEGRIVYDLDESQTTETLDAPWRGVDYLITFANVATIELPDGGDGGPPARVTLRGGEALELERSGDLGPGNAGVLVFTGGAAEPRYVPWSDVVRIAFGS